MRLLRSTPALARRTLLGGLALSALGLAGCTSSPESGEHADGLLDAHSLSGLDAREIIDELEALPLAERPTDLLAAVLPDRLSLTDAAGREASLPLPTDAFYVSVAPFVDATHECFHHSLTTCLGELQEQEVEVLATTAEEQVLLDEVRTTAPNGFLGLWLPRDRELALTLTYNGVGATMSLRTDAESPTCLTTMQLVD